jgi:hypothetical protein
MIFEEIQKRLDQDLEEYKDDEEREREEKKQKFLSQVEDHPGLPNNACKYLFLPYTNNFHYRH